jgi:hypothetical protein
VSIGSEVVATEGEIGLDGWVGVKVGVGRANVGGGETVTVVGKGTAVTVDC